MDLQDHIETATMPAIRSVLLVEDSVADAALVRHYLKNLPAGAPHVHHAKSLAEATDALRGAGFDCVLLDLGLPDGRGLDNVRRMRAANQDVPIVVMTALDDDKLAIEALRSGAQEYLVKGTHDSVALGRVLQHAIERHRLVAELDKQRQ